MDKLSHIWRIRVSPLVTLFIMRGLYFIRAICYRETKDCDNCHYHSCKMFTIKNNINWKGRTSKQD